MTDMSPSQQRRSIKRRKAAVDRALRYLNDGLAGLLGVRLGTAERRVKEATQPMSTAKALVKEWRGRIDTPPAPVADDRAALVRAAVAIELGHGWPAGEQREAA